MSAPLVSNPAYRIETKRLVLRCWQPEDATRLQEATALNKEHLLAFMPWAVDEPTSVEAKVELLRRFRASFDRGEDYVYGVFNPTESRVLGGSGLHPRIGTDGFEIGYWIHKDFVGQGLATEVAGALTKVAFEVYFVQRMEIHCAVENLPSAAVPRKLGYVHEATRRRLGFAHGRASDSMIWTLFSDEYPTTPSASADLRAFDIIGNPLL